MHLSLPFAHLNLCWNPFGAVTHHDRAALAVVDLPELATGDIVQFIGEAGCGKTTHLLALAKRYPAATYIHIREGEDGASIQRMESNVLLLDEAQRVRARVLRRLLAHVATVALGSHEDCSPLTRRRVKTIRLKGLTPERLHAIVSRRIEWARRGPGAVPYVPVETLRSLIEWHGDNLRAIEGHLYELFQSLEVPTHVEV